MSIRVAICIGDPEVIDTSPPFSNFDFREKRFPNCTPLGRILSQARSLGYRTMVIEKITSSEFALHDDEDLAAAGKTAIGHFKGSDLFRLTFFDQNFRDSRSTQGISEEHFLGYAIVKGNTFEQFTQWVVFESIVNMRRHDNAYFHARKEYQIRSVDKVFSLSGNLFCQQNGITNVCAHAALRVAIASFEGLNDIDYREINQILATSGIPYKPNTGTGLNMDQIRAVLQSKGIGFFEMKLQDKFPFQQYLYGSVESGYPAILIFGTNSSSGQSHAVPVFGHTFNDDTWVPNAEVGYFSKGLGINVMSSEKWVSTYIAHDDNFGSNYCIPRTYFGNPSNQIALGLIPSPCTCNAMIAEIIGVWFLFEVQKILSRLNAKRNEIWLNRLCHALTKNSAIVVTRPILLHQKTYVSHLKEMSGWDGSKLQNDQINGISEYLGGNFWMIEVSLQELFPTNRRKLGEVLIRCDTVPKTEPDLMKSVIIARLPGVWLFPDAQGKIIDADNSLISHTELFSFLKPSPSNTPNRSIYTRLLELMRSLRG